MVMKLSSLVAKFLAKFLQLINPIALKYGLNSNTKDYLNFVSTVVSLIISPKIAIYTLLSVTKSMS